MLELDVLVTAMKQGADAGAEDLFATLVLAVIKSRLRVRVDVGREPYHDDLSAYRCKVDLVLLTEPSTFEDEDDTGGVVIGSAESSFRIPQGG
jgi:hypothetical protein